MLWNLSLGTSVLLGASVLGYWQWQGRAADDQTGPLTLQEPAAAMTTFLAIGDYGTGDKNQLAVFRAMEKHCREHHPQALLLLGDNIYMDGVESIDDPKWQSVIEEPFDQNPCLDKLPRYAVLGNHDYKGNPDAQIQYSTIQPLWKMPARFYSVQFGNLVEVVGIDTNISDICFDTKKCVLDFAQNRLLESEAKWKLVMGHHPLTSASSKHSNTFHGWVMKRFICSANAYIAGHSHHLEHRKDNNCSADLFISGAGGADIYEPEADAQSLYAEGAYGFLEVSATPSQLRFRFFNTENEERYYYQIESGSPRITQN